MKNAAALHNKMTPCKLNPTSQKKAVMRAVELAKAFRNLPKVLNTKIIS